MFLKNVKNPPAAVSLLCFKALKNIENWHLPDGLFVWFTSKISKNPPDIVSLLSFKALENVKNWPLPD